MLGRIKKWLWWTERAKETEETFVELSKAIRLAGMEHSRNLELMRKRYDEHMRQLPAMANDIRELHGKYVDLESQVVDTHNTSFARVAERQLEIANSHLDRGNEVQKELLSRWSIQVDDLRAHNSELRILYETEKQFRESDKRHIQMLRGEVDKLRSELDKLNQQIFKLTAGDAVINKKSDAGAFVVTGGAGGATGSDGEITANISDVLNRLPTPHFLNPSEERFPRDIFGAEIIRIGAPFTSGGPSHFEGGGLVIDYIPSGESQFRRLVLEFNEGGMWLHKPVPTAQCSIVPPDIDFAAEREAVANEYRKKCFAEAAAIKAELENTPDNESKLLRDRLAELERQGITE